MQAAFPEGVVEGRHWSVQPDGRIQCDVCPRRCRLADGQRGLCFVRARQGGRIVLTTWGRSSGFCVDPVEKKPLNHFLPGSSILSFGTAGCNLACTFCQNWDISKSRETDKLADRATPEAVAHAARKLGCKSVAFTYNDPVIFMEYAIDIAQACHDVGIKAVAASPLTVAAYRSGVAAVVLWLVLRPALRGWSALVLLAAGCYAGCVVTFVVATKWTTAANAIFLQYSSVVWVMLLSPLVLAEPLRTRDAAAIAVALVGLGLFFVGRFDTAGHAGDLVALVSGLFQAGLILALRRERGRGAEAAVTWGNFLVLGGLLPLVLRRYREAEDRRLSARDLGR